MSASPHDLTPTINPLDALIASYIQAVECGQVPNRQDLLQQNPDHAEALLAFFTDFDRMDRVVAPLRMSDAMDETAAIDPNSPISPPTVRYFGDYELLEEIARGGMGIVYKARQTSLNRLVALKMVLAGAFASSKDVQRFRIEAEAAANLDHPHIVPVYEVGEHDDQQYFSMKFVEGTSLAHHKRGTPKEEVAGLIQVARAVDHAHRRGILHRDLKPSNVLVDAEGARLVTDFGLAKRLSDLDTSLTETGQLLGTPRYMSPEQASGRKDLTVAADVYSLGVILYERLTGRTPFLADNVGSLLHQVRESDPPRLSTITPGLGRDLETIALKCLDRDPARRYPSAEALAVDLENWLSGRPITARPVGALDRSWRWCKRNPAVATLMATVAVSLLAGTIVSTAFALQERKARVRAEKAEDRTERALARSLLRPIDPEVDRYSPDSFNYTFPRLTMPEIESLWELAKIENESIKLRYVDDAIGDPLTLRQLRSRSEPAFVAAIGLDSDRKTLVARSLESHLSRGDLSLVRKAEIALLLLDLGEQSGYRSEQATMTILQLLASKFPDDAVSEITKHLLNSLNFYNDRMAANLAISVAHQGADSSVQSTFQRRLPPLCERLTPDEATVIYRREAQTFFNAVDRDNKSINVQNLRVLAIMMSQLGGIEATRMANVLTAKITRDPQSPLRVYFTEYLEMVASRLDPEEAPVISKTLSEALANEKDARVAYYLSKTLTTISRKFDVSKSERVSERVTRRLVNSLAQASEPSDRKGWAQALGEVAKLTDTEGCAIISEALANDIERGGSIQVLVQLGSVLGQVSSRLYARDAARVCERAVREFEVTLEHEIASLDDDENWYDLAEILAELATRLSRDQSESVCNRASNALARAIQRPRKINSDNPLGRALYRMTAYKSEAGLIRMSDEFEQILRSKFVDALLLTPNAYALSVVSSRLGKAEAERICVDAARTLLAYFNREKISVYRMALSQGLNELVQIINIKNAIEIADILASAIQRSGVDAKERQVLVGTLSKLMERLPRDQARKISQQIVASIFNDFSKTTSGTWTALDRHMIRACFAPFELRTSRYLAYEFAAGIIDRTELDVESLQAVLRNNGQEKQFERAIEFATISLGQGSSYAAATLANKPYRCRLTTDDLTELLKMPTCFGKARRIVLDELESIHGRRFANHWEFVRFAQEKGLKLDFTTPPRRPDPKASLQRLLDALPK